MPDHLAHLADEGFEALRQNSLFPRRRSASSVALRISHMVGSEIGQVKPFKTAIAKKTALMAVRSGSPKEILESLNVCLTPRSSRKSRHQGGCDLYSWNLPPSMDILDETS